MDEQFSKWWEQEVEKMRQGDNMKVRYIANKVFTDDAKVIFSAAYSLGLAKGRKEGMEDEPSGWLITGSRTYQDAVAKTEQSADQRIKERNDGASYKVPLYAIRQAAQGGEGGE